MIEPDLHGPIRCSVEVFDLDNAPAYAALSYTWGPELPVYDILIQGRALSIRKNLHQFLKCFRKDKKRPWQVERLYLFVDQICIDQSDPDERNRQVQLMSQIYYKSSELIVWLNDERGQSTKAARELNRYSTKSSSLAKLLVNDYFTRLWIVQEILLGPWFWIYTPGSLWVSWETLWKATRLIPSGVFEGEPGFPAWEAVPINTLKLVNFVTRLSAQYRTSAPWKSAPSPNNLSWSRFVSKAGRRTELAEILEVLTFSANTCYEPRDKVYGLMNLLTVEHRLIVDYNKPVYDVFKDLILELHSVIRFKDDKDYSQWAIATQKLGADMGIDSDDVIDLLALLEFMRLIVPSKARVSEGAILPALVSKIGVAIEDAPGASSSERFGPPLITSWAYTRASFHARTRKSTERQNCRATSQVLAASENSSFSNRYAITKSLRIPNQRVNNGNLSCNRSQKCVHFKAKKFTSHGTIVLMTKSSSITPPPIGNSSSEYPPSEWPESSKSMKRSDTAKRHRRERD
jgi:hypothetical protein